MRGKNYIALPSSAKLLLAIAVALLACAAIALPSRVSFAAELPQAAGSPLTGISFDDRPLLLPVQRNFQMAMLTASSQIGRSCGRMESYGWRLPQTEQHRVDLIFSNTVDRLRSLGYTVEAQTPTSISKDITLFTADRPDKHFLFMWSAGEIGLVMVLCESSPPLTGHMATMFNTSSASMVPLPQEVVQSKLEPAPAIKGRKLYDANGFTPVGDWIGDYTCMRGYTGATMHIDKFKGEDFKGTLRFYPTGKNAYIPRGSYAIYGQYDKESKRILINPGNWIEHPPGYYKTIIIGSFDPVQRSFSGFFQGIMGCTSFEAKSDGKSAEITPKKVASKKAAPKHVRKHIKPKKKVQPVAEKPVPAAVKNPTPDEALAHAPAPASAPSPANPPAAPANVTPATLAPPKASAPASPVVAPAPAASTPPASASMPSSAAPSTTTPRSAPASEPASGPPLAVAPSPTPPPAASVPAPAAAPVTSPTPAAPSVVPPPLGPPPSSVPAPGAAPIPGQPTSSLAPRPGPHAIVLAGDWPPTPWPPVIPPVTTYNSVAPRYPVQSAYEVTNDEVQKAQEYPVNNTEYPDTSRYNVTTPPLPPTTEYGTEAQGISRVSTYYAEVPGVPEAEHYNTYIAPLPDAESYTIYKAPGS